MNTIRPRGIIFQALLPILPNHAAVRGVPVVIPRIGLGGVLAVNGQPGASRKGPRAHLIDRLGDHHGGQRATEIEGTELNGGHALGNDDGGQPIAPGECTLTDHRHLSGNAAVADTRDQLSGLSFDDAVIAAIVVGVVRAHGKRGQGGTAAEGVGAHGGHTGGNGYGNESVTVAKRAALQGIHGVRDGDGSKTTTTAEGILTNDGHTLRNGDRSQLLLILEGLSLDLGNPSSIGSRGRDDQILILAGSQTYHGVRTILQFLEFQTHAVFDGGTAWQFAWEPLALRVLSR